MQTTQKTSLRTNALNSTTLNFSFFD